jgi:TolB-like protein
VFLVLLGFGMLAAQPRLVVFEFEPVMADIGITKVVVSLLRDRLAETKAFSEVVTSSARPTTVPAADSIAKTLGADQAIVGSVARIGSGFLISYKLVSVTTGELLLADRASLGSESELDVVTERIARSVRDRRQFGTTQHAGQLTSAEAKSVEPASSILFTTGYTFPIFNNFPDDPGLMLFTLDAAVSYEMDRFMALAQMGLSTGKQGYQDIHFELLGHKLLGQSDISPYFGGGLGIHRISFYGIEDNGLSVTASGGVLVFRNNVFRIVGSGKATALFMQEFGVSCNGGLYFGLASAGFGPSGKAKTPPACIYGALGVFFVTGLIVALTT